MAQFSVETIKCSVFVLKQGMLYSKVSQYLVMAGDKL